MNFLLNSKLSSKIDVVSLMAFVVEILKLIDCDEIENQLKNFYLF